MNLIQSILLSLTFLKFLFHNWLRCPSLVVQRSMEKRANCSISNQMNIDLINIDFYEQFSNVACCYFSILLQIHPFHGWKPSVVSKYCHVLPFLCLAGFFWADSLSNGRETRWMFLFKSEGKDICFCGEQLESLKSPRSSYVDPLMTLKASTIKGYIFLKQWNRSLYSNLIDQLFVAKFNQKMTDGNRPCILILVN